MVEQYRKNHSGLFSLFKVLRPVNLYPEKTSTIEYTICQYSRHFFDMDLVQKVKNFGFCLFLMSEDFLCLFNFSVI